MRLTAAFCLATSLIIALPAEAQVAEVPEVKFPELADHGAHAQDFVPAGWMLESEQKGDLNKDGIDDLVLVLRDNDSANLVMTEMYLDQPVNTNPRMLAAALGDGKGGYDLVLSNSQLIPRITSSTESDPLSEMGGVSIERGSIVVAIYYFSSAGGTDMGTMMFRLRYENGDFRLIGYDRYNVNRMSGDIENVSANLLNRKVIVKTGNIGIDEDTTSFRTLKSAVSISIDNIGEAWSFSPEY